MYSLTSSRSTHEERRKIEDKQSNGGIVASRNDLHHVTHIALDILCIFI